MAPIDDDESTRSARFEPPEPPDPLVGPTARRMVLGSQLRRLRENSGLSRNEAGYNIRGSASKISRIELGRVSFKERDIHDLLLMYGVGDPADREAFVTLVRESNQPGWWHRYNDLLPKWFDDLVGLEEAAVRIQTYELQLVPGLLQTEEYALAIAGGGRTEVVDDEVRRRVALRMRRQRLLQRPDAPRMWAVLDESVLHRPIGGREVLRGQIRKLLELTEQAHITVQVLPMEFSGYAAEGSFTMLRFAEPELPDVVYSEHLAGALYLDKRDEIERYRRAVDRLLVDSLTPERSRQLLNKRHAELDSAA